MSEGRKPRIVRGDVESIWAIGVGAALRSDERVHVALLAASCRADPRVAATIMLRWFDSARVPNYAAREKYFESVADVDQEAALVRGEGRWFDRAAAEDPSDGVLAPIDHSDELEYAVQLFQAELSRIAAGESGPRISVATEVPVFYEGHSKGIDDPSALDAIRAGIVDLSFCLELSQKARLQILVEAKLRGEPHRIEVDLGNDESVLLLQPGAYAAAWSASRIRQGADIRIVATIGVEDGWIRDFEEHWIGQHLDRQGHVAVAGDVGWDEAWEIVTDAGDRAQVLEVLPHVSLT